MLFPNNEYFKSRLEYYTNKVEIEKTEILKMMKKFEEFVDEILYVLQNLDKQKISTEDIGFRLMSGYIYPDTTSEDLFRFSKQNHVFISVIV